jgi:hypothetical protein
MKLDPICIGCLFNQVLKGFELLDSNISKETILETQRKLMKLFLETDINKLKAPLPGKYVYNLIAEVLKQDDPFKELKDKYNQLALKYYDDVKELINNSDDPLFMAIIVSALGNTIDFASQHKIDIISDLKKFNVKDLVINDFIKFKDSLARKDKLVILLDNAGEIVFDKILIEILKEKYNNLEIICAVRSTPIINDATLKDAKDINLTSLVTVIESSPAPGIDLSDISKDLEDLLQSDDIILLSKGQGNFESIHGIEFPTKDVFFLLKAKCKLMEKIFEVNIGNLIFKRNLIDK